MFNAPLVFDAPLGVSLIKAIAQLLCGNGDRLCFDYFYNTANSSVYCTIEVIILAELKNSLISTSRAVQIIFITSIETVRLSLFKRLENK